MNGITIQDEKPLWRRILEFPLVAMLIALLFFLLATALGALPWQFVSIGQLATADRAHGDQHRPGAGRLQTRDRPSGRACRATTFRRKDRFPLWARASRQALVLFTAVVGIAAFSGSITIIWTGRRDRDLLARTGRHGDYAAASWRSCCFAGSCFGGSRNSRAAGSRCW